MGLGINNCTEKKTTGGEARQPVFENEMDTKPKHTIRICLGSACYSKARHDNLEYIEIFLKKYHLLEEVDFRGHLCIGKCKHGPNVEIDGLMYSEVDSEKLEGMLKRHFGVKEQ